MIVGGTEKVEDFVRALHKLLLAINLYFDLISSKVPLFACVCQPESYSAQVIFPNSWNLGTPMD